VPKPALPQMGAMPAFGPVLTDRQIADLVAFLRHQYAPDQKPWTDLEQKVAALRTATARATHP
jgi:nicotinate dehydrogenase subunit B